MSGDLVHRRRGRHRGTFTDTAVGDEHGALATYKSPTTPVALLEGLLANLPEAAGERDLDEFLGEVERIARRTTAATNRLHRASLVSHGAAERPRVR